MCFNAQGTPACPSAFCRQGADAQMPTIPYMRSIPLPSVAQTQVVLEPTLKSTCYRTPNSLPLTWDVRMSPSFARMGRSKQVPLNTWCRPVVSPKALAVRVRSEALPLFIQISCGRLGFVTVYDLLEGLYRNLHLPIRNEEREVLMKRNPGGWKSVYDAFELRCEMSPYRLHETWRGVKRVDILRSVCFLAGFELDPLDPSILWMKFM